MRFLYLILIFLSISFFGFSQENQVPLDYNQPTKYEIEEITISGTQFLDPNAIISITGFKVGDIIKIPSDDITNAVNKLWAQGILGNIEVSVTKFNGKYISLNFHLTERPRLSKFNFKGMKKTDIDDVKEKIRLVKGKVLTDAMLESIKNTIKKHYAEKGFLNTSVKTIQLKDTTFPNSVILNIDVEKKTKIKIGEIVFVGNNDFETNKLKRKLKDTKEKRWYKIFTGAKYKKKEYEDDKKKLITYYNNKGYRDAEILSDSIYKLTDDRIGIRINISEGRKYYFRNISWIGNYTYSTKTLDSILAIKKGDVYNTEKLDSKLHFSQNSLDISSLYLDNGYLFFSVEPVETKVDGDSIDIELRVHEGTQATIDKIKIAGNTKTNDHVILREIRTLPGEKFSRADIIRSQRELSQLGYFDPEKINITPIPNPTKGTVDIEYTVVEKPSDQLQLSGGWGGYYGFMGTLGLSFNNFSLRNIPNFKKWDPLPAGDGQRFNINFQSNGPQYQNFSTSFSEPWLGGKKPHSFTVSLSHSVQRTGVVGGFGGNSSAFNTMGGLGGLNGYSSPYLGYSTASLPKGSLQLSSVSVSLGKRLRWPDDYFTLLHSASYMLYSLDNYRLFTSDFTSGTANNFSITNTLSRNSIDNPTYPRRGSSITMSMALTPPYSIFQNNRDFNHETTAQKFKFVEYHKWMFDMNWFTQLAGKLVLSTRAHMGYLGSYNPKMPIGPFERFVLGGSGLTGYNYMLGSDVIGLRGYADASIGPTGTTRGGVAYNKYVCEIRYPISLNPAATVFLLTFAEGGNNWSNYKEVNPFKVYRSAGMGARIFMPAFGMIGVDYGFGFDKVPGNPNANHNRFTFSIGQQIR